MNKLLMSDAIEETGGFWGRQLRGTQTPGKAAFDIIFGILLPLLCFYLDPGIIRGGLPTPLGQLSIFIYSFSGLAILALLLWFAFGHRMRSSSPIIGGVLAAGAVVSFSIGVMILPLTLIGIIFVVGLLGLVPFVTGFVYLRNAVRAFRTDSSQSAGSPRLATLVLSALLAIGLPASAQLKVNQIVRESMAEIMNPDSGSVDMAVQRIKRFSGVVDTDRMVREYENESNPLRKQKLARAYKEITGEELERRLAVLND